MRFATLCRRVTDSETIDDPYDKQERRLLVGELRSRLARVCLVHLKPTLIILDEFQRFKDLLDTHSEDDTEEDISLGEEFFRCTRADNVARILLLSATPYKMYTQAHEEEDHYHDFLHTMRFLQSTTITTDFKMMIHNYRQMLLHLDGKDNIPALLQAKQDLEHHLKHVMVRTERLAATADRNGMLNDQPAMPDVMLSTGDIDAYLAVSQIANLTDHPDVMEYWKSVPYLLNFMTREDYKFKHNFQSACENASQSATLAEVVQETQQTVLNWDDIESYAEIDPGNARLRTLISDVIDRGAWQLLWMPPAFPYYQLRGPFADPALECFSKRLVFSGWRVVPKVIATMLSYEVERRIATQSPQKVLNTKESRSRRSTPLRLSLSEGRLSPMSMNVWCLLYPCLSFATRCDPLRIIIRQEQQKHMNQIFKANTLLEYLKQRIRSLLEKYLASHFPASSTIDSNWYWAAPILLDRKLHPRAMRAWIKQQELRYIVSRATSQNQEDETVETSDTWEKHLQRLRELVDGRYIPSGKPPDDLVDVLAEMALAAPGTVAFRALHRTTAGTSDVDKLSDICINALHIGWAFRSLFNNPDVATMIQSARTEQPYWRQALHYCVQGCLQSVLDEYVHVLYENNGLRSKSFEESMETLTSIVCNVVRLRTVNLGVDAVEVLPDAPALNIESRRLRSHFAARFGDERATDDQDVAGKTRPNQVRAAFNSPFWPFVLATTSIGQEGLDFHPYCHAVMHWNLPSNPVDLEQREGRVHRYEGHAVRKNLARRYGIQHVADLMPSKPPYPNPWPALLKAAARDPDKPADHRGMFPYWICEGPAKIERYVPVLPLSRDEERLSRLRRALVLYRMVFGQVRQEDLIHHLLQHMKQEDVDYFTEKLRIDLSPPPSGEAPCEGEYERR